MIIIILQQFGKFIYDQQCTNRSILDIQCIMNINYIALPSLFTFIFSAEDYQLFLNYPNQKENLFHLNNFFLFLLSLFKILFFLQLIGVLYGIIKMKKKTNQDFQRKLSQIYQNENKNYLQNIKKKQTKKFKGNKKVIFRQSETQRKFDLNKKSEENLNFKNQIYKTKLVQIVEAKQTNYSYYSRNFRHILMHVYYRIFVVVIIFIYLILLAFQTIYNNIYLTYFFIALFWLQSFLYIFAFGLFNCKRHNIKCLLKCKKQLFYLMLNIFSILYLFSFYPNFRIFRALQSIRLIKLFDIVNLIKQFKNIKTLCIILQLVNIIMDSLCFLLIVIFCFILVYFICLTIILNFRPNNYCLINGQIIFHQQFYCQSNNGTFKQIESPFKFSFNYILKVIINQNLREQSIVFVQYYHPFGIFIIIGIFYNCHIFLPILLKVLFVQNYIFKKNYNQGFFSLVSKKQQNIFKLHKIFLKKKLKKFIKPPSNRLRKWIFDQIYSRKFFQIYFFILFIVNIIILSISNTNNNSLLLAFQYFILLNFHIQLAIKLISIDVHFFSEFMNIIDLLFILLNDAYFFIALYVTSFQFNTLLLIIKIFSIGKFKVLQNYVHLFYQSLYEIGFELLSLIFIFLVSLFLFSLISLNLFGMHHNRMQPKLNYETFRSSLQSNILLLKSYRLQNQMQRLTFNPINCSSLYQQNIINETSQTCGTIMAYIYLTLHYFWFDIVISSLFMSIIIKKFVGKIQELELKVTPNQIERILSIWSKYDNNGTGLMQCTKFPFFIYEIDYPMGFKNYNKSIIITNKKKFKYIHYEKKSLEYYLYKRENVSKKSYNINTYFQCNESNRNLTKEEVDIVINQFKNIRLFDKNMIHYVDFVNYITKRSVYIKEEEGGFNINISKYKYSKQMMNQFRQLQIEQFPKFKNQFKKEPKFFLAHAYAALFLKKRINMKNVQKQKRKVTKEKRTKQKQSKRESIKDFKSEIPVRIKQTKTIRINEKEIRNYKQIQTQVWEIKQKQ